MILSNSSVTLLSAAAPKGAKADAPAAGGDFSALFAALALPGGEAADGAPEQPEAKADPAALLALALAASGKPAVHSGKSGKNLPLPLPPGNPVPAKDAATAEPAVAELTVAEQEQPADVAPAPRATLALMPAMAPLDTPLPAPMAEPASAAAPAAQPTAEPAARKWDAAMAPNASSTSASASSAPASTADGSPRVLLQVAAQPVAPTALDAAAAPVAETRTAPLVAPAPLAAAVIAEASPAEARPRSSARLQSATSHPAQSAMPLADSALATAPIAADAATPFPLMPVHGAAQSAAGAGQDLAAIVDRLAAARDALAPTSAALTIDHAEFGELSLRFDQKADGGLSIQLAAATPEAHRAITTAVGAEGSAFLASDGQAQQQAQPQAQAQQNSSTPGGSSASGHAAERDPRSGQSQRQDQSPRQQQAQRQPSADRNPKAGDGIFA